MTIFTSGFPQIRWRLLIALGSFVGWFAIWFTLRPSCIETGNSRIALLWLVANYGLCWICYGSIFHTSFKKWCFRFTAFSIGLVIVTVCMELATAIGVDYGAIFKVSPWHFTKAHSVADPELLTIHRPNERFQGTTKGGNVAYYWNLKSDELFTFDIQLDGNGFRNNQDLEQADIAVIGDSFVEAREVDHSQIFTSLLATDLKQTIANLGHTGYGPQQELVVLKRYATTLKPKICVWVFYEGNDLKDAALYDQRKQELFQHARVSWWQRSFILNLSRTIAFHTGHHRSDPKARTRYGETLLNQCRDRFYFLESGTDLDKKSQDALIIVQDTFRAAYEHCQRNDMELVVLFAPSTFRVYHDLCEYPSGSDCLQWTINDLPKRLKGLLSEINSDIKFIDPTESLRSKAQLGEKTYFTDDTHWTPAGHRVIADEIIVALQRDSSS